MGKRHANVLMVDGDIALLLVLAKELDQRGIGLIPAGSVSQARSFTAKLDPAFDMLIINCRIPGVSGLATEMAGRKPGLEVIGIISGNHQCNACRPLLTYCFHDPELRDVRWMQRMMSLIQSRLGKPQKPAVIRILRSSKS